MILFFLYYLWIILSIIFYFCIKTYFCKYEYKLYENRKEVKITWPLYAIILYFIFTLIPVINFFICILDIALICDEYYMKESVKNKWNNSWIIRNLKKEY